MMPGNVTVPQAGNGISTTTNCESISNIYRVRCGTVPTNKRAKLTGDVQKTLHTLEMGLFVYILKGIDINGLKVFPFENRKMVNPE